MNKLQKLSQALTDAGFNGAKWLKRYKHTFKGVPLEGKTVIDIGAGVGWASFYAAACGAKHITAIEPQGDGSRDDMLENFMQIRSVLGFEDEVQLFVGTLEDFPVTRQYDLVVVNNAINHFNEDACSRLHLDPNAREEYLELFAKIGEVAAPCATLLVTDCSRRNLFGDLGIRNPVAPTIEWDKHQAPEMWAFLLGQHGFNNPKISWLPVVPLGLPGRLIGTNRVGAYLLNSHFKLTMIRAPERQPAVA